MICYKETYLTNNKLNSYIGTDSNKIKIYGSILPLLCCLTTFLEKS